MCWFSVKQPLRYYYISRTELFLQDEVSQSIEPVQQLTDTQRSLFYCIRHPPPNPTSPEKKKKNGSQVDSLLAGFFHGNNFQGSL